MALRVENSTNTFYKSSANRHPFYAERLLFDFSGNPSGADKSKTAAAREKAMKSNEKRLVYYEAKKGGFFSRTQPAYYEYTANGKETIYTIKQKFGIKDGALAKFNSSYRENESTNSCIPSAGTKLRFYASDVE